MPLAAPVIAAIIGGGAGIGAAAISAHSNGSIADQQQKQAQQLIDRSGPAYNNAQNYYNGLLNNPTQQPGFTDTQLQFNQAQKNLINSSYSRGGGLDAGLANLQAGKAATISQLLQGGRQTGAAGLTQLATGQSAQGLAGLAGAANTQNQNNILNSQGAAGIGSFLTRLLSSGSFGQGNNGSNYFGVNMNANNGSIPAAIIPRTGQPFAGADDPFPSQV